MNRHYIRCVDCLAIACTTEIPESWLCSCGGQIEYMGKVTRDLLTRTVNTTPCDHRCTGANWPNCDCKCNGENHGTGKMIDKTYDMGSIPVVKIGNQSIAGEWRELATRVPDIIHAAYPEIAQKNNGKWVANWSRYLEGMSLFRTYHDARKLRQHSLRVKKILWIYSACGITPPNRDALC